MDPAPSFLYEMDPNGSGNHAESRAQVSPQVSLQNPHQQLSAERSLWKEKRDVNKMRPAEMPGNEVKSYQKTDQQAVQHLPALVSLTQAQAHVSSIGLNFLPAAFPPPPHLQALPPGAIPELLRPPCSPTPSYWLPPASPHWLRSNFGFSPYLLPPFSSPPEFWCNPWLFSPILCPQMMPTHQTCAADQASGSMQTHVTPASERGEKHAGTGEDQQEGNTGTDNNPGSKRKITDSPELSPFWYEKVMEEDGFEESMKLLDSFFAQAKKTGEECRDAGTQKVENNSFLEYLDELCSDKDFVRKVESLLKIETFTPSLSSDQDLLDVFAQEQREQEIPSLPANSAPLSEETAPLSYEQVSQVLLLDPPGIQSAATLKQKEQNSPRTEDWICGSALLSSHLLEAPPPADPVAEGPVKDPFSPPEESQTPLDACSAPPPLFSDTSQVSGLESSDGVDTTLSLSLMELRIHTTPPPGESPSTSRQGPDLSANLLTESLQKSTCQPPHPQPPAPIGKPEGQLSSRFDAAHGLSLAVHPDPDSFNLPVRRTLSELEPENQTEKPAKPRRGAQEEREGKRVEMRGPQKQRVMKGGKKKVGRKTFGKEEQVRKNNIKVKPSILIRYNQRRLDESEPEKDGERKTREENGKKTAKLTPKRNEAVQQKRGENELFKRKKGNKRSRKTKTTSTDEQLLEMAKKEKLKNPQLEAGKWGEPSDLTFCSETGLSKNPFSTRKRVQPISITRRKTKRSQEDREQTGKSSPEGETEGMKLQGTEFVLQNVPIISPVKRSRSMRGGEKKASAAKIREKTASARPTKETKAPLDEGRKPERPTSCCKSTSANTSVTTSPPTWCRKSPRFKHQP